MTIPSNLLPVNSDFLSTRTNPLGQFTGQVNEISSQFSQVGQQIDQATEQLDVVENLSSEAAARLAIISAAIPDELFTGSIEDMKANAKNAIKILSQSLRIPEIPDISVVLPELPTITLPSYSEMKDYVQVKIDSIKQKRIEAFSEAQDLLVSQSLTPFAMRRNMAAEAQSSLFLKLKDRVKPSL